MDTETILCRDMFDTEKTISLAGGEVLHRDDETCHSMGMVIEGELQLSRILSNGKELHIKSFRPGDLYAELIVFTGGRYPGWLTARVPTKVVEVGLAGVLEHLADGHNLASFMAGIAGKMTQLSNLIEIQSLRSVRQKIAFALLYGDTGFTSDPESGRPAAEMNVTRFASYIGCTREAVSRALSGMETETLMERRNGVLTSLDRTGLENLLSDIGDARKKPPPIGARRT